MSYSRAFERTLLKRGLDGEKAKPISPPNGAQGERNNYIGFLESQLDKISSVGEQTIILSDKIDNLHTSLTIHEERLLNQARLLNLTQEAIDQGNQQHVKVIGSMKERVDQLEEQIKALQTKCATPSPKSASPPGAANIQSVALTDDMLRDFTHKIQTLQDVQAQQSRQLTLLQYQPSYQPSDGNDILRLKNQLDSLDSYVQKAIAEIKTDSTRLSTVESAVLNMMPELKSSVLATCESTLTGKISETVIAELKKEIDYRVTKSVKSLSDNLMLAILPEVKKYVKETIGNAQDEMRRETSTLGAAIHNINEDMNRARSRVSATQGEVKTLIRVMDEIKSQMEHIEREERAEKARNVLFSSDTKRGRDPSPRTHRSVIGDGNGDDNREHKVKNGIWTDQKRIYTTFQPLSDKQYIPIAIPTCSPRSSHSPPRLSGDHFSSSDVQSRIREMLMSSPQLRKRSTSAGADGNSDSERDYREERKEKARGKVKGKGVRHVRSSSADNTLADSRGLTAIMKELQSSGKMYSSSSAADGVGKRSAGSSCAKGVSVKNGRSSGDGTRGSAKTAVASGGLRTKR